MVENFYQSYREFSEEETSKMEGILECKMDYASCLKEWKGKGKTSPIWYYIIRSKEAPTLMDREILRTSGLEVQTNQGNPTGTKKSKLDTDSRSDNKILVSV